MEEEPVDLKERLLLCPDGGEERLMERVWAEQRKLWVVAIPAIFARISTFGVSVMSLAFMGYIGVTELAAYAIVFTVIVRFANGVLLGMASALQTLCWQSWGTGQHHKLGIHLQRSWLVLLPITVALLPVFLFTTPILRLLAQDEAVALMAGKISPWFIPAIFSYGLSFTLQMYLQCQNKNWVITYWAVLSLGLHASLSWFLSMKLELGVAGVMTSTIVSLWVPIVGQLFYVFCGCCPDTWKGFSSGAFKDLWPVVKISFSSGIMLCLESWYNTILVLLTGRMQDADVAIDALSICINISGLGLMIPLGFLAAIAVRVANELGAGSAENARFSVVICSLTSATIGLMLLLVFLLLPGRVSYIFSESDMVARAVSGLSPLLAWSILVNSLQPVASGVAIGAGWQSVVAYVNLVSYYFIGIPLAAMFGYLFNLGVKGVWIGMITGTAAQTATLVFLSITTDWEKQVALAQIRVKRWHVAKSEDQYASEESA